MSDPPSDRPTTGARAWRPPEAYRHGGVVIVPARVAEILDRCFRLRELRTRARGRDAELAAVLVALTTAAAEWRTSVIGNLDPLPAETTAGCTWMTARQAADRLGLTERRVRQLAAAGELPARLNAGRWEVDRIELEHYAAGRLAA